jgi:hypothetical protein
MYQVRAMMAGLDAVYAAIARPVASDQVENTDGRDKATDTAATKQPISATKGGTHNEIEAQAKQQSDYCI